MMTLALTAAVLLLCLVLAAAAAPSAPFFEDAGRLVVSPEVHPDRRVTFRFYAPRAREVHLVAAGMYATLGEAVPLTRDSDGVWSVTVGPLEPEVYDYGFSIDGSLRTIDNANPHVEVLKWGSLSWVEVPGDEPMFHDARNVPHGTVHAHWYPSGPVGTTRRMLVYTPPGYEDAPDARYPVLVLLHGAGQEETSWTSPGRANLILDNLLAEGKATPMIVAMPYGHVRRPWRPDDGELRSRHQALFQRDLLEEVIPRVDSLYRTLSGAGHRGIAGLSMGGGQAARIGLRDPDHFAWVGIFSGAVPAADYPDAFPELAAGAVRGQPPVRLVWIGCGRGEPLRRANEGLVAFLKEHNVNCEFHTNPGGHTFINWRRCLHQFAQELF